MPDQSFHRPKFREFCEPLRAWGVADRAPMELPPKMGRQVALPPNLQPRLVSREVAAAYVCVSPNKFDMMVRDGRMPRARRIDGRKVWSVPELNIAADNLPVDGEDASIDPSWEDIDAA